MGSPEVSAPEQQHHKAAGAQQAAAAGELRSIAQETLQPWGQGRQGWHPLCTSATWGSGTPKHRDGATQQAKLAQCTAAQHQVLGWGLQTPGE